MKPKHIIVGLSGGVDSSVAAYLLKAAGHRVTAVFMKNWEGDDTDTYCKAAEDLADAKAVADQLDIEIKLVNFADEYWERVFGYFLDEYRQGRTPNPDVLCNKEIKFRAFLDYAKQMGADFIATGHYARVQHAAHDTFLLKGCDPDKDQSYFLHALNSEQLAASLFPIGEMKKNDVRALAKKLNLPTFAKKDSTGICFIGERRFKTFLNEYLPANPGVIETDAGERIGQHDGLMFYTIGQRQGLHIGGMRGQHEGAWYVVAKDLARNVLIVVQGSEHPLLFRSQLMAAHLHWINAAPTLPIKLQAKTRYRQMDQACTLHSADQAGQYLVEFDMPQRATTPGQFVVFYEGERCLGGGVIQ